MKGPLAIRRENPHKWAMPRIKLTIAYDGTEYSGWQFQPRDRTVQGVVEAAIAKILGAQVRVHGSGRTDAGVHAMGQVAHFDCPEGRDIPWQKALNGLMPKDVRVLEATCVPDDFHARYTARSKTYEYVLWNNPTYCLPQRRLYVWAYTGLDMDAMEQAASIFLGEHDFAAFQNVGTEVKSTVRTITEISRHKGMTEHETIWRFTANGFLKQMVRNLMGCLVAVGNGRLSQDDVKRILESADRTQAPASAPPHGLSLMNVEYSLSE